MSWSRGLWECCKSFSDFKNSLAELLVEKISPISDKIKDYKNDKEQLKKILKNGNEKASDTANKTMIEVKKILLKLFCVLAMIMIALKRFW